MITNLKPIPVIRSDSGSKNALFSKVTDLFGSNLDTE